MSRSHDLTGAFNRIESGNGWDKQFRYISQVAKTYPYHCKVARRPENDGRNRYMDVSPFDHSRVLLVGGDNDYINSSLLENESSGRRYILTQGPLGHTSGHMWQMVWEQKSKAVVMLNKVIEKGALKCHQYWPTKMNETANFPSTGFSATLLKEESHANFVIREISLTNHHISKERTIFQFHYTAWPDFGVPESPDAFLEFMICVQECGVLEEDVGPAVIHCSAGIGRTGTFCLVEICTQLLKQSQQFDITEVLLDMRKYRMGLIQTPQQLRFSYQAIVQYEAGYEQQQETSFPYTSDIHTSSGSTKEGSKKEGSKKEGSKKEGSKKEGSKKKITDAEVVNERKRSSSSADSHSTDSLKKPKISVADDQEVPTVSGAIIKQEEDKSSHQVVRNRKTNSDKQESLRKRVAEVKEKMKASERSIKSSASSWKGTRRSSPTAPATIVSSSASSILGGSSTPQSAAR